MSHRMLRGLITAAGMFLATGISHGLTDPWDLPPVRYSETPPADPLTKWFEKLDPASTIGLSALQRLDLILRHLGIPQESQILVFSKTSKQNNLIHPANPRSIFFHENAYVGYVPGGDIEIITHDPQLGAIFHLASASDRDAPLTIRRDSSSCLSCHGTARTENAPGVLVRSVFPDPHGQPILPLGSFDIDDRSPIAERWGGYYVTGRTSLPHMGNRTYREDHDHAASHKPETLHTLRDRITTQNYLQETSDIVALMVLEHQCHVHNLIASASLQYRRSVWLRKALDPNANPDTPQQTRITAGAAHNILKALLFADEADMGDGVEGTSAFQDAFTTRYPKTKDGKSLADFHLQSRLFKSRCSFMIYSDVFASTPTPLRREIIRQLRAVITSESPPTDFIHLKSSERKRIADILAETWPAWNE